MKKISKTFRLSERAVEILNQQPNATEYLEEVIGGIAKAGTPQFTETTNGSVNDTEKILKYMKSMEERLTSLFPLQEYPPQPQFTNTNVGSVPPQKKNISFRTRKDVLQDIEREKQSLQDLLEVNQDPKDHAIKQQFIQELWDEYHSIEEDEELHAEKA